MLENLVVSQEADQILIDLAVSKKDLDVILSE